MKKEEYHKQLHKKEALKELVQQDPYRLQFHLMPPTGWLNDPNGLCQYDGTHHIYFQYSPYTPLWASKIWGHYTTKDFVHYTEEEPFLFTSCEEDKDGVYSGSAFIEEDTIYYFYTGNVKCTDKEYDYIQTGREQNTMCITSKDGFHHSEKQVLLTNEEYPSDMSLHVRDPKVCKIKDMYYMVIGARSKQNTGCVLLYASSDLQNWKYHMRIESETPFGYMWECPDLFVLDEQWYLLCCPQGVTQQGYAYANVYQCGYFPIELDVEKKTYQLSPFVELDRGFDIYATQTYEDEKHRRIVYGWMGIPDADYHNQPTIDKGWQHALTMPRVLISENKRIRQQPLVEMQALRDTKKTYTTTIQTISLPILSEIQINLQDTNEFKIRIKEEITLTYAQNVLTLSLGDCGCGRTNRSVPLKRLDNLQIFVDTSALEIFVNEGKEVFTTRYYQNTSSTLQVEKAFIGKIRIYALHPYAFDYQ